MWLAAGTIDGCADDLDAIVADLARLAAEHRDTRQLGRTLLAKALPTTFGRLVHGWLAGVADARVALDRVRGRVAGRAVGRAGRHAGGPGTGHRVRAPNWDWPRRRRAGTPTVIRVAELASALGMVTGALGKIAGDVVLLAQAEIGELTEGSPGGSSAMPDKRNSARSVQILACAHRAPGLVGTVFAGLPQELQRAAGRWQAEWETVGDLLALTTAAVRHTRVLLAELKVDTERMGERL